MYFTILCIQQEAHGPKRSPKGIVNIFVNVSPTGRPSWMTKSAAARNSIKQIIMVCGEGAKSH